MLPGRFPFSLAIRDSIASHLNLRVPLLACPALRDTRTAAALLDKTAVAPEEPANLAAIEY
jgi:hypothetical protein